MCMAVVYIVEMRQMELRREALIEAAARSRRGVIPNRDSRVYWKDPSGVISGNVMGVGILVCGEDGVWLVEERDTWRNRPVALSDIGGKCEKVKGIRRACDANPCGIRNKIECPWDTIGREFVEETYGSLGEISNMKELWEKGKKVVCTLPSPANIRGRIVRDVKYVCLVVDVKDIKGVVWDVDKFNEGRKRACEWVENEKNGNGGWVGTDSKEWEDEVSTVGLRYVLYSELRDNVLSGRLRNILKLMGMIV